jgi:hypothetical protein
MRAEASRKIAPLSGRFGVELVAIVKLVEQVKRFVQESKR